MRLFTEDDMGYFPLIDGEDIVIMARERGELTDGYRRDVVTLIGDRRSANGPLSQVQLVMQNGADGSYALAPVAESGSCGDLFVADFTGSGQEQVWMTLQRSECVRQYGLYAVMNGQMTLLFQPEEMAAREQWDVRYLEQYRVAVDAPQYGKTWELDIRSMPQNALADMYRWDGQLQFPATGSISPEWMIQPLRTQPGSMWRLLASRALLGAREKLGYVQMMLAWNGNTFWPETVDVVVNGRER